MGFEGGGYHDKARTMVTQSPPPAVGREGREKSLSSDKGRGNISLKREPDFSPGERAEEVILKEN